MKLYHLQTTSIHLVKFRLDIPNRLGRVWPQTICSPGPPHRAPPPNPGNKLTRVYAHWEYHWKKLWVRIKVTSLCSWQLSKSLIENVKSISSKPKNLKYLCFFLFVTEIHPKGHEIYLWFIFHKKNNWQPLKNMTFAYFYLFTLRSFIDTVMGKQVKINKSLIENVRSILSKLKNLINFTIFFLLRRYTQKKLEIYRWFRFIRKITGPL